MRERPKTLGCAALLTLLAALHGAPTAEATTGSAATVLCGDVTGDGRIDVGDALAIAQLDVGLRTAVPHPENCDVNGDGRCDLGDALRIAQCTVGLVPCAFTCPPPPTTTTTTTDPTTTTRSTTTTTLVGGSGPVTGLHYAPNRNLDSSGNYVPARAGFTLADVSSVSELDSLPSGVKGLVWLGLCNGADSSFINAVRPFIGHPKLFGFYLMDEPDPTGQWAPLCTAANLKAESDWIHANVPGAKTFIVMMNFDTSIAPTYANTYNPGNSHIDLYGLDPYPCRTEVGGCDYAMIPAAVAAAEVAGIPLGSIVPVYQAFGGGGWSDDGGGTYTLPTSSQEQQIFATWAPRVPNPVFDYAYSWGTQNSDQALESSTALQAVFAAHNTTSAGVSTRTTTAEAAAVLCGDVTGDGQVNVGDALAIAQLDAGLRTTVPHPENCDVNGDGRCDLGDALRIAQCTVGLVPCAFTCPPPPTTSTTTTTTTTTRPSTTTTRPPTTTTTTKASTTTTTTRPSTIRTVFLILLENHDWSSIKNSSSAPYINRTLLPIASHAERYYNPPNNHPSLPNYLWLEAGTNFGILDGNDPSQNAQSTSSHLVDLLEARGISWKTYQEDEGSGAFDGTYCPIGNDGNYYDVDHNPFVYFDDVTQNNDPSATRCIQHVRPYSELARDLTNNTVARYNFITPHLCHDMHSTCAPLNDPVLQGDTWLSTEVPKILASQAYLNNGALFILWDEGDAADGPIGMIVLSPKAKGSGYANTIAYDHGSTLRTIEEIFDVAPMLGSAASATDLRDLFGSFP